MSSLTGYISALAVCLGVAGCKAGEGPSAVAPPVSDSAGNALVWLTCGDRSKLLSREPDLTIHRSSLPGSPAVMVDTASRFQSIEGFGAALTGSSAYLLHQ